MDQIIWSVLYFFGNLILASAMGCLFIYLLESFKLPTICKFLTGFALHPFAIGLYMMAISILPIRLPNVVYVLIPYICALFFGWLYCLRRKKSLSSLWTSANLNCCCAKICFFAILASILKVFIVSKKVSPCLFAIFLFVSELVIFFCQNKINCTIGKKQKIIDCAVFLLLSLIIYCSYFFKEFFPFVLCSLVFLLLYGILSASAFKSCVDDDERFLRGVFNLFMLVYPSVDIAVRFLRELMALKESLPGGRLWPAFFKIKDVRAIVLLLALFSFSFLILTVFLFINSRIKLKKKECRRMFVNLCVLFAFFIVVSFVATRGICVIEGSDAIQYTSEAREFASKMTVESINDYHGDENGALLADIHNPIWSTYIANALLYSDKLGYPNDYCARMSFMFSYLCFLIAFFSVGYSVCGGWGAIVVCVIFFANRFSYDLVANSSRDLFRISALLCFFITILGKPQKNSIKSIAVAVFIGFCVMSAHPINAMQAIIIVLAYFVWIILKKDFHFADNVVFFLPYAVGAFLGCCQILFAYIETGSVSGGEIDFETVLRGTSFYNTYLNGMMASMGSETSYPSRIYRILLFDRGIVSIPALIASIMLTVKILKNRTYRDAYVFVVILVALQIFCFTDAIGWSGRKYTEWLYRNYRYSMNLYVFYALAICVALKNLLASKTVCARGVGYGFILFFCSVVTLLAFFYHFIRYPKEMVSDKYMEVNDIVAEISPRKLLLDNYNMNYYLNNEGLCFWTKKFNDLRRAETNEQFYKEMKKSNMSAILITKSYFDIYWKNTILDSFIQSDYIDKHLVISEKDRVWYDIYFICK